MSNDILLEVQNLKVHFPTERGIVRAVDGVTFDLKRGRTMGVVGESGCGKSITSLSVMRLLQKPGRIVDGKILYHARQSETNASATNEIIDIVRLDADSAKMRSIRGGHIGMVFQEPMTSLDPVYTIGNQMIEGISMHRSVSPTEARAIALDMLDRVNMPDPKRVIDAYPHQLSGGMRQRVMIATALSCRPGLLIADEPTTALDVTTEAQILELLRDLQRDFGMAIMYITHNLGVVAEMVEEAIVMYLGKVVERASVVDLFYQPKHPYMKALLRSIPKLGRKSSARLQAISGMVPSPFAIPPGCSFHPRCPDFIPGVCNVIDPAVVDVGNGHLVKCHLYGQPKAPETANAPAARAAAQALAGGAQ
ncbi:MAG: Oligopeptide transport ATP-binding protein OppD [Chloroflexi bacterium ADurb.Bin325]|nr:MAG: Oligopeptide transport ATP-binding protein OppD [Chloroflexi bacterium ADurb.Bin325]